MPSRLRKVVYSAQAEAPVVYAFKAGGRTLHIQLPQGTELLFPQELPHSAQPWGVQPYRANTTHRIGVDANLLQPYLSSAQPLVASAVTESLQRGQPEWAFCHLPGGLWLGYRRALDRMQPLLASHAAARSNDQLVKVPTPPHRLAWQSGPIFHFFPRQPDPTMEGPLPPCIQEHIHCDLSGLPFSWTWG